MRSILLAIVLMICTLSFGQQVRPKPTLKNLRDRYAYGPSKSYRGPSTYQHEPPATMDESFDEDEGGNESRQGTVNYTDEDLERDRQLRPLPPAPPEEQNSGSGSNGTKPRDPEMGKPVYEDPDENYEEVDSPDMDLDVDGPSEAFWRVLLFIVLGIVVALVIYFIIKNYRPRQRAVPAAFTPEELNPEIITKSELELRLEEAMKREDYRECVRIYFTFILKELIRLRRIRWKKELTNRDYVMQMYKHDAKRQFEESVRIFDLIWYGEYAINRQEYQQVERPLAAYYQQLNNENA